jgi:hypothetical protein
MIIGPVNHSICGITPVSSRSETDGLSMPSTNAISLAEFGTQYFKCC